MTQPRSLAQIGERVKVKIVEGLRGEFLRAGPGTGVVTGKVPFHHGALIRDRTRGQLWSWRPIYRVELLHLDRTLQPTA
jgi:hypothetical protein